MTHRQRLSVFALCAAIIIVLSGCAQYQIQSNKAVGYSRTIDRLVVWSAVKQVPPFAKKRLLQTDTFENIFHATLKRELVKTGAVVEVWAFTPSLDTAVSRARLEKDIAPTMRLFVTPTNYQTLTSNIGTDVTLVVFDLSLFDAASNERVWRAQLTIDGRMEAIGGQKDADLLTQKIIDALAKDKLLVAPPPLNNSSVVLVN